MAICRVDHTIIKAVKLLSAGAAFELTLTIIGSHLGGLEGLCLGWVIGVFVESVFAAPLVYRSAAFFADTSERRWRDDGELSQFVTSQQNGHEPAMGLPTADYPEAQVEGITHSCEETMATSEEKGNLWIEILSHNGKKANVAVKQDCLAIGRSPSNNVVLDDPFVSRVHLRVTRSVNQGLTVTDLVTANGTRLDSVSLIPTIPSEWHVGQIVVVGNTRLSLKQPPSHELAYQSEPIAEAKAADVNVLFGDSLDSIHVSETLRKTERSDLDSQKPEPLANNVVFVQGSRSLSGAFLGTPDRQSMVVALLFLAYIGIAEVLTFFADPLWGLPLYGIVLVTLLIYSAANRQHPINQLLLSLTLVSTIRFLDLSLPMINLPMTIRYLIVGFSLLLATLYMMWSLRLSLREIGFNLGQLPFQILVGSTGVILGLLLYGLLGPIPSIQVSVWEHSALITAFSLFGLGFVEELAFRGLIQKTAEDSLGVLGGIAYVASLYTILQMGHYQWLNVFVVFCVACFYSWVVYKSKSILGVAISHGLINIMVFLVLPALVVGAVGGV